MVRCLLICSSFLLLPSCSQPTTFMKNRFLLLLSVPLLSSCAGGWSPEYRKQFLDVCKTDANAWAISDEQANSYCDCRLGVMMSHYETMEEVLVNKDSIAVQKDFATCDAAVGK